MIWNLIGVFVIVPSAPIMLQLGLPGPFQTIHQSARRTGGAHLSNVDRIDGRRSIVCPD